MRCRPPLSAAVLAMLVCVTGWNVAAADVNPAFLEGMKWRQIGPFRGGRVIAVSGVPGDPSTCYFGGVAGGVWKSTDAGSSWRPVFDDQKISSIGAIAVSDSDHNFIYVGTGELAKWRAVSDADLPALQALMRDHGVPSIVATP